MSIYNDIANIPSSLLGPSFTEYTPRVTQEDIDKQYIIRYFTRQVNVRIGEITEINKDVYNDLQKNSLWQTVMVTWRIAGALDDVYGVPDVNTPVRLFTGVLTANGNSTIAADLEMPGLKDKLNDPSQFYNFGVDASQFNTNTL
jgi:hypothetical protein